MNERLTKSRGVAWKLWAEACGLFLTGLVTGLVSFGLIALLYPFARARDFAVDFNDWVWTRWALTVREASKGRA